MIVFLHGVPETARLWDKVRARIGSESVALSLPGFGCARPDGFGATMDDYVDWVLDELHGIGEPVHLVGHDWGAGFTYRIATAHGERLRSWAADVANVGHPDYQWHQFARIWQTPEEGEAFFSAQEAVPVEARAQAFESLGLDAEDALSLVSATDATMASCILDLYRSALPNPFTHWRTAWGPTSAPGLVLCPADDPFGDEALSVQVAESLGARHRVLPGVGHFWPLQAPDDAAAVLRAFIDEVERPSSRL